MLNVSFACLEMQIEVRRAGRCAPGRQYYSIEYDKYSPFLARAKKNFQQVQLARIFNTDLVLRERWVPCGPLPADIFLPFRAKIETPL